MNIYFWRKCWFRKGRTCSDCIFIMGQLIQKRKEFHLPTCVLFTDYETVFDRVPQCKLWNIMKEEGFPDHILRTVQSLYMNTRIKGDKGASASNNEMQINQEVEQVCPMSQHYSLYLLTKSLYNGKKF